MPDYVYPSKDSQFHISTTSVFHLPVSPLHISLLYFTIGVTKLEGIVSPIEVECYASTNLHYRLDNWSSILGRGWDFFSSPSCPD